MFKLDKRRKRRGMQGLDVRRCARDVKESGEDTPELGVKKEREGLK